MTNKERMLAAIRLQQPDRVPCTPDFSNMIPCKLTGRPYWDIYYHGTPDLYYAYAKAAETYGIDGWYCSSGVRMIRKRTPDYRFEQEIEQRTEERMKVVTRHRFGEGALTARNVYYRADPPTPTEKLIKDLQRDLPLWMKLHGEITGCDDSDLDNQRAVCGDRGVFTLTVGYPGIHAFHNEMEGGTIEAVYAVMDQPELMDEWAAFVHKDSLRQAEILLDHKPDLLLLGASGTLTLSNPALVRRFSLPTIKALTQMAREAGVATMLHSCGRSEALVEMLYHETDLNCINPLEEPPMGDVYLSDMKRRFGDRLCLMGNLHTTNVMLNGTPADVRTASLRAIRDAGLGGGFILSTGDQCGRDTPAENLFAMVETAKTHGQYPLDMDRIDALLKEK